MMPMFIQYLVYQPRFINWHVFQFWGQLLCLCPPVNVYRTCCMSGATLGALCVCNDLCCDVTVFTNVCM